MKNMGGGAALNTALKMTLSFFFLPKFPTPVVATEVVSNEEAPSTSQGLPLGPQLPPAEPQLDLEQQWQDIMAIMELQVCSPPAQCHLMTFSDFYLSHVTLHGREMLVWQNPT